jgi:hypothetical protein
LFQNYVNRQHLGGDFGDLEIFFIETETNAMLRFYHYNLWAFVLLLGVGYWFLAKEPIRNRVVALIGSIGKLFFAASCVHLLLINHAKPILIMAVIYDGFFGILMAIFYWKTRNEKL